MEFENNGLIINKAFMSKNNALKIQYNKNVNQIYVHAGKKDNDKWIWIKSKFNDAEIGEILRHKLPQTTEIYAKVNIVGLRALAKPWPGGVDHE